MKTFGFLLISMVGTLALLLFLFWAHQGFDALALSAGLVLLSAVLTGILWSRFNHSNS